MKKAMQKLIVLIVATTASALWAQTTYLPSQYAHTPAKPNVVQESPPATAAVYRGPTLSTALPATGRFSNGLALAPLAPRRPVSPALESPPQSQSLAPAFDRRPAAGLSPSPPLSGVRVNTNDFARSIVFRSIYGDLGGLGTGTTPAF